jgi:DNA processing protein
MKEPGSVLTVGLTDHRYPPLLREIAKPPSPLYVRGDAAILASEMAIAVVGTRMMTRYGRMAIRRMVPEWCRAGALIVSGLALGVDTEVHAAVLDCGGKTAAVLASGVDDARISPSSNRPLAHRMLKAGNAILSEYPEGAMPYPQRFPARNRIVAGIAQATVVIEAPAKSGALITAYSALDADRDVFAVPGPIDSPASEGCNALIAKGAIPLLGAETLFAHYGMTATAQDPLPLAAELSGTAQKVHAILKKAPSTIDGIATELDMPTSHISTTIVELEMMGLLSSENGILRIA